MLCCYFVSFRHRRKLTKYMPPRPPSPTTAEAMTEETTTEGQRFNINLKHEGNSNGIKATNGRHSTR